MAKVSRREFVVATAVAAAAGMAQGAETPQPSAQAAPPPNPANNPEVEARIQWIFTKYGARLNDEQRADIRRLLSGGQSGLETMRAFPLENSDAPATRFRVWRRT
jgi:hypothetical protein